MNVAWWLESATWEHANKIAMIDGADESKTTYGELNQLTNRIGNVLRSRFGVEEGDVVCTLLTENVWHLALMQAVYKIGAVFCALNRGQVLDKFKYDIGVTKPKLLVVNRDFLNIGRQLLRETELKQIAVCDDLISEFVNIKDLVPEASEQLRIIQRSNTDVCIINFTAGTSGSSKGAMLTHGNYNATALATITGDGITSKDAFLIPTYFFHTAGLHNTLTGIAARATLIYLNGWDADRAIYFFDKYKPTWNLIAPIMVRDMARRERFTQLDLKGCKFHLAGEPVPPEVQELLEERGARSLDTYGMTETMGMAALKAEFYYEDDMVVPKGAAKRNKNYSTVKLVDPTTGNEVAEPFVRGEIYVKGDVVAKGYYRDIERTTRNFDADGWFHTNDLAYFDEGGYIFVGGRADDIINSGAEKLSLIELDEFLRKHPKVKDVACIGVKHDRFGEVPAAFIVPAENADEEALKAELDQYCKDNLERWKRPRLYSFLEIIPRTLAKQTKDMQKLKAEVADVVLRDEDGVVTMNYLRRGEKTNA